MSEFYLPHVERNISRTNALLSLGCCVRCTLRALRVTHPSCYRIPYHELESKVRSILSQAKVSESPTHTDTKPDESDTTLSTTEDTTTCIDTAKPNSDPMSENTVEDAVTVDDAVSKSIQGTKRTQTDTEIGEGGSNGPKKQKLDNQGKQ
ncbi:hypothetical protein SARC_15161 [Sphaeroforma arctica JP610]|uniref:Uncharacterized protein n=1 Tax=Sphaeroforma arctica JP610 TaxID=667725 RepID=A0A0L0F6D4_9EUKA|nr:hypothetical protein SARC_15161 [Sphaeroforma arctica JP610]KNC72285.1 hypothetical protein SARC_15161 [Sphaeroforma arctica JP610]|eukprot:XP_014146187.1 hypothetical protein SARC_15161 [Sphaeroforma arctica JP610]